MDFGNLNDVELYSLMDYIFPKRTESDAQKVFPTSHPFVENEDGSVSNVILSGATIPWSGGKQKVVVFPTMIGGKQYKPNEALSIAEKFGIWQYPLFDTIEDANKWAETNHDKIDAFGYWHPKGIKLPKKKSGSKAHRNP